MHVHSFVHVVCQDSVVKGALDTILTKKNICFGNW